jgi:mono/diheme cytochrome c family protein
VQPQIVLLKSVLTVFALLFAIVLPALGLTAWYSTRLQDPTKTKLFTMHRWIGRGYVLIIVVVGVVYCLLSIGPRGYDHRVFLHSALGLTVLALVAIKVLTARGLIPQLSDHLPKIGTLVALVTIGIFFTSAFWYFRAQATAVTPAYGASPGQTLFEQKCSQCHDISRATSSPRSRDAWAATINRMVSQNGAAISPSEQAQILDYLSSTYGGK